jgi:hypothetical protein
MEHPKFIQKVHRFFNPVSQAELRQLEKMRQHITAKEYERRKIELENPNYTTYGKVYTMLLLSVVAVAVVVAMVISRG